MYVHACIWKTCALPRRHARVSLSVTRAYIYRPTAADALTLSLSLSCFSLLWYRREHAGTTLMHSHTRTYTLTRTVTDMMIHDTGARGNYMLLDINTQTQIHRRAHIYLYKTVTHATPKRHMYIRDRHKLTSNWYVREKCLSTVWLSLRNRTLWSSYNVYMWIYRFFVSRTGVRPERDIYTTLLSSTIATMASSLHILRLYLQNFVLPG